MTTTLSDFQLLDGSERARPYTGSRPCQAWPGYSDPQRRTPGDCGEPAAWQVTRTGHLRVPLCEHHAAEFVRRLQFEEVVASGRPRVVTRQTK